MVGRLGNVLVYMQAIFGSLIPRPTYQPISDCFPPFNKNKVHSQKANIVYSLVNKTQSVPSSVCANNLSFKVYISGR